MPAPATAPVKRALPADKKTKADEVAANCGLVLKEARQVERTREDETVVVENLATYVLQDETTITVDLDNPEAEKIVEKAKNNVQRQIDAGNRAPKKV